MIYRQVIPLLWAILVQSITAASECQAIEPDGPFFIDSECIDPLYSQPLIDSRQQVTSPTNLHLVLGHFNDTQTEFELYLPTFSTWQGRFFQLVYPSQSETPTNETLAFGAENGAVTVQVTGTTGYRAEAAGAKFARSFISEYYNCTGTVYGYIYGGSGGSLQTVGAAENTQGVWDGSVPFIQAIPISIPLNYGARGLGALAIKDRLEQVQDAVKPGGSGDPFSVIDGGARAGLLEATRWGHPLRGWENYTFASSTANLRMLVDLITSGDPTYVDDFWSQPGYLGIEDSELGCMFRAELTDRIVTIGGVERDGDGNLTSITLDSGLDRVILGLEFTILRDNATISTIEGTLNPQSTTLTLLPGQNQTVLATITAGDALHLTNRRILAAFSYHRHQISYRNYTSFSPFLNLINAPIYPQRPVEIPSSIARGASGGATHTGKIRSKMIVIDTLLDMDAMPAHADWYRQQVARSLGERFDSSYRLWYIDNSDHALEEAGGASANRLVLVSGAVHQAVKDLAAWVERGVEPPASSGYEIREGQVVLDDDVSARGGIQPAVRLEVDGRQKVETSTGMTVNFSVSAEVPNSVGKIVRLEWDFRGTGEFVSSPLESSGSVEASAMFVYDEPGEYIVAVRVTSRRDEEQKQSDVANLGRMRVIVN
ncbi:hypothetical protein C1H76_7959 [Elsinoe australis]|uniref:PKD domain-containing protein n=1 Tax=Elsinoe australis TaxID=40998 RepID=A0A4U7AT84_9PEZI|nr:hypothetical protein C1H76_7959 [Elsinoe australis]